MYLRQMIKNNNVVTLYYIIYNYKIKSQRKNKNPDSDLEWGSSIKDGKNKQSDLWDPIIGFRWHCFSPRVPQALIESSVCLAL